MSDVIKTIRGKTVEFGASKQLYHYVIYDYVKFKTVEDEEITIPKLGIFVKLQKDFEDGKNVAFQIALAEELKQSEGISYVCGIQKKTGAVLSDSHPVRAGYKTRLFAAIALTIIPPGMLAAPFYYKRAFKIKNAIQEVGEFEPLEKNFVSTAKRKKF